MESGSEPANLSSRPNLAIADLVGTAIALLTLTLPLLAIAYYSSGSTESLPPVNRFLPHSRK